MSLSPAERHLLERHLARRRRHSSKAMAGVAMALLLALVATPAIAVAGVAAAAVGGYLALNGELEQGLSRLQNLEDRETFQTTRIVDRKGVLLREVFNEGKRTNVPLSEIPTIFQQATVAVEDKSFYDNPGIDVEGIARAVKGEAEAFGGKLLGDADASSSAGGGSTITQQFVRHVAFSYEERIRRSYTRKIKEIVLSLMITRRYSKDEILEWYLNEIYYGNLAYGAEAAAQTVFGKPARALDLAESALLVGLPQLPATYDPLDPSPETHRRVKARQRTVLDLMVANGLVTRAEADRAAREELKFVEVKPEVFDAPHFVVYVQKLIEERFGAEILAHGGLTITTTIDLDMQRLAESEARERVEALRERNNVTNAAVVTMEPRTGEILAMVGSVDYWDDAIDGRVNVSLAERQPGSSIKPITYVTALANGMSPATTLWDVPMQLWTPNGLYEPENYDGRFRGPVRLRESLANSYNIPALKLLNAIQPLAGNDEDDGKHGVELTVAMAKKMGITGLNRDPWDYGLSLTLGGGEVTLLDLTTAYGTLANGGQLVRPNAILRVTTATGEVLYDLADDEDALAPVDAVDPRAAYIVTDFLSDNNARAPSFGTNSPLNLGIAAAAKTGTTNDFRDNWTVGYTPYLVTGVWAGNSDNAPMRNSSGLTGAAPIWNGVMRNIVADDDLRGRVRAIREDLGFDWPTRFARPDGIVERSVCRLASLNATLSTACPETIPELFIGEYSSATNAEVGARDDAWSVMAAVVVPLPPPPPELVAEAEANKKPLRWAPAALCRADAGAYGADKAQAVAVLSLPADEEERGFVREWAHTNRWVALEPTAPCTPEMADAALSAGSLPGSDTAIAGDGFLTTPTNARYSLNLAPGTRLSANTVLTGTAMFNPDEIEYYKVEFGPGVEPVEWITIGGVHATSVPDGPLETLDASSLAPGPYIVRLVLVKRDGNFLQPPYSVPIIVGPEPPDEGG